MMKKSLLVALVLGCFILLSNSSFAETTWETEQITIISDSGIAIVFALNPETNLIGTFAISNNSAKFGEMIPKQLNVCTINGKISQTCEAVNTKHFETIEFVSTYETSKNSRTYYPLEYIDRGNCWIPVDAKKYPEHGVQLVYLMCAVKGETILAITNLDRQLNTIWDEPSNSVRKFNILEVSCVNGDVFYILANKSEAIISEEWEEISKLPTFPKLEH